MSIPDPPLPSKALDGAGSETGPSTDDSSGFARDWRAVVVAITGFVAIVVVVVVGLKMLPGPIDATKQTDNASGTIGGAIGAGVAAIGSIVAAYFGIRSANQSAAAATEAAQKSAQVATEAAQTSAQAVAQTAQDTATKAQQTSERLQTQNEKLQAANERTQVTLNEVAGAAPREAVQDGLDRAASKIRELKLAE